MNKNFYLELDDDQELSESQLVRPHRNNTKPPKRRVFDDAETAKSGRPLKKRTKPWHARQDN